MSGIEWTDVTENPIRLEGGGHWCSKVSEGCANCYAEALNGSTRFDWASGYEYVGEAPPEDFIFKQELIDAWKTSKGKKRFICSMTDLFGGWVPKEWHWAIFDGAAQAPQQTIQLLTKRPEVALWSVWSWCEAREVDSLPSNIWMGVTAENNARFQERVPILREIPVGIRWVSCEPLLGEIDFTKAFTDSCFICSGMGQVGSLGTKCFNCKGSGRTVSDREEDRIEWVVLGGESGPKARTCQMQWMESAIAQVQDFDSRVFVKQLGADPMYYGNSLNRGGANKNIEQWPHQLRIRQFPEPLLDTNTQAA